MKKPRFCAHCGNQILGQGKKYCSTSCRSLHAWQDPKFVESSLRGLKNAQTSWREKYENDPEFKEQWDTRLLQQGFHKMKEKNAEEFRTFTKKARSQRKEYSEELLTHLSIIASERVRDKNDSFGTRKGKMVAYNGYLLRSSWEHSFAQECDKRNIAWTYEEKTFVLSSGKRYTPDFYLSKYSLFIEIKPKYFSTDEVRVKCLEVQEQCNIPVYILALQEQQAFLDSLLAGE